MEILASSEPAGVYGLRSSAGPLRDVAVRLGRGLTTLYGRNGAGKSWLLKAIGDVFLGEYLPNTHLIVHLPGGCANGWVRSIVGAPHGSDSESPGSFIHQAIEDWFREGGKGERNFLGAAHVPEGLVQELAGSPFLAVVPKGTKEPQWDVWVCAELDASRFPKVHEAWKLFERLEEATAAFRTSCSNAWQLSIMIDNDDWDQELATGLITALEQSFAKYSAAIIECGRGSVDKGTSDAVKAIVDMWGPVADTTVLEDYLVSASPLSEWMSVAVAGWLWDDNWTDVDETFENHSGPYLRRMVDDGLPFPVAKIGSTTRLPWTAHDEMASVDVDQITTILFEEAIDTQYDDEGEVVDFTVNADLQRWLSDLETEANSILQRLLQDAPQLRLLISPIREWLINPPIRWCSVTEIASVQAPDRRPVVEVPILELSTAERRWAQIAIRQALARHASKKHLGRRWPPGTRIPEADILLIDEPEAALHRVAERHMSTALAELTTMGQQVVVATHSPDLLNQPEACLVHVERSPGGPTTTSQPRAIDFEESMVALGLVPSDLIGMYRVFLLVEGEHDEIVLRAFIDSELNLARVKIIVLRGAVKLPSTVESQLLFDMTRAPLVAVLDNVNAAAVETAWEGAKERYLMEGSERAIDFITTELRNRRGDEYVWIATWLARALKKGVHERFLPYGLTARDIIEYLPSQLLVPSANKTWRQLRDEHQLAADRSSKFRDFKHWLHYAYNADLSLDNIRHAAAVVNRIPEEFRRLGYQLRNMSKRPQ